MKIIYESIILFMISFIILLYMYHINKDNIIGRYYQKESPVLYNIFNLNLIIIKMTMLFNVKFLASIIVFKYII